MPDYTPSDSFKQASMADKIAFLSEKVPGFGKLDPKSQGDYVNHLLGNEAPEAPQTSPLTEKFNDFTAKHSILGPIARTANSAVETIAGIPKAIYHAAADPLTPEEQQDFQGHTQIPGEVTLERLTGARDIVNAGKTYADPETRPSLSQATEVLPEALGQGIGTVAGSEIGGRAIGAAKPGLGRLTRSATDNSLKPVVKVAGKLGGAAIGHATGIPEAGVAGFLTGSQALDGILPDNPEAIARQAADARDAAFNADAEARMRRGREQDALDRKAAVASRQAAKNAPPPNPFPNATPTAPETMPSTAPITPAPAPAASSTSTSFHTGTSQFQVPGISAQGGQGPTSPPVEGEPGSGPQPASLPDQGTVLHLPEPKPTPPGFINLMNSIPRDQLLPAAQRGQPGAIDQLRDMSQPSIIIPKGTGYGGPRPDSTVTFPPPTLPAIPLEGTQPPPAPTGTLPADTGLPGAKAAASPFQASQLIRKPTPPVVPPQQ